jgi:hypothetical protein
MAVAWGGIATRNLLHISIDLAHFSPNMWVNHASTPALFDLSWQP